MDHDAYVRRETVISVLINSALSALFFWLVFRGIDPVPVWGIGNWIFDFIPQSFMIAFMSTLVPGALAAKALRDGRILPDGPANRLPRGLVRRAVMLGFASALIGTAIVAAFAVGFGTVELRAATAGAIKVVYGAVLALLVTPPSLRRALARVVDGSKG